MLGQYPSSEQLEKLLQDHPNRKRLPGERIEAGDIIVSMGVRFQAAPDTVIGDMVSYMDVRCFEPVNNQVKPEISNSKSKTTMLEFLKSQREFMLTYLRETGLHHVDIGQEVYLVSTVPYNQPPRESVKLTIIDKQLHEKSVYGRKVQDVWYRFTPTFDRCDSFSQSLELLPGIPFYKFFLSKKEAEDYVKCVNIWRAIEPHL